MDTKKIDSAESKVKNLIDSLGRGNIKNLDELSIAVNNTLDLEEKNIVCSEFIFRQYKKVIEIIKKRQEKRQDSSIAYI